MTRPGERIYKQARAATDEIIEALALCPRDSRASLAANLAIAAQLDAVIVELDREHDRRCQWETLVEMRLGAIEQHEALSVPSLPKFELSGTEIFDPGSSRYDFEEET